MNTKVKYNSILFLLFACVTLRAVKIHNETKTSYDVKILGFYIKELPTGGYAPFTIYEECLESGAKKTISSEQTREIMVSWSKVGGNKKKLKSVD